MGGHRWSGRQCSDSGNLIFNLLKHLIIKKINLNNFPQFELGGTMQSPKQIPVSVMDLGKMLLHCSREGETAKVKELMGRGAPFTTDWVRSFFLKNYSLFKMFSNLFDNFPVGNLTTPCGCLQQSLRYV